MTDFHLQATLKSSKQNHLSSRLLRLTKLKLQTYYPEIMAFIFQEWVKISHTNLAPCMQTHHNTRLIIEYT
jgi:hypothetical protein